MHPIFKGYDIIIFDCDGVILDSNNLKIDAMRNALRIAKIPKFEVDHCCGYFKNNFGKSRFHHIQYFMENFITSRDEYLYDKILDLYSKQCSELYLRAQLTPNFIGAISDCTAKLYIASGSAQEELQNVFIQRELEKYFELILGSPTSKADNIAKILNCSYKKAVMIGDSIADFHAAKLNNIDFIGYLPFSNVKEELEGLSENNDFHTLRSW